jgi:hypothetical protein
MPGAVRQSRPCESFVQVNGDTGQRRYRSTAIQVNGDAGCHRLGDVEAVVGAGQQPAGRSHNGSTNRRMRRWWIETLAGASGNMEPGVGYDKVFISATSRYACACRL